MIAKVIARDNATSSFSRLTEYILEAKTVDAAVLWVNTAEYVMDINGEGEKLAWFDITNCESETPADAIAEVLLTQNENTRTKHDKTYHLVISFREGEHPTREQLKAIEESICQGLGYGDHQRISACHINTENTHLHIAINKIHPKRLTCHEPHFPYLRLDRLCKELEIKHNLERDNRISDRRGHEKAQRLEAHTGEQSFLTWVKETVYPVVEKTLTDNASWQSLHDTLAEFGVEIKPRGAGLVIASTDGQYHVKASDVHRSIAMKGLTRLLGPYEKSERQNEVQPPKEVYSQQTKVRSGKHSALYTSYREQQQQAWQLRKELKETQLQERQSFTEAMKAWHFSERERIKHRSASRQDKQRQYSQLSQEKESRWKEFNAKAKVEREALFTQHPVYSWQSFLRHEAEQGNTEALEALRAYHLHKEAVSTALLTANNVDVARHIIFKNLKPYAKKNGDLVYRVADGGLVIDSKAHVRVDEVTAGSAFLALSIAIEKFKDQPLRLEGSDDFKQQVVDLAKQYNLNVCFDDPALQQKMVLEKQVVLQDVKGKGIEELQQSLER